MIVSFSGVDCAGKTTQIEQLAARLRDEGRSVEVVWYRPGYSDELDAVRATIRRFRPAAIPAPGPSTARSQTFSRPEVRLAWVAMATADTVLQLALKLRAQTLRRDVVICDRYIDDAAIDLELRFPELSQLVGLTTAAMWALCPRPSHAFLLNLPLDEQERRVEAKREPFPDAPELRRARHAAYQRLVARGVHHVLDASASMEAIHAEIAATLRSAG